MADVFFLGKGPSIWDTYTHEGHNVASGMTGDVAADSYHHIDEDVAMLVQLGVSIYIILILLYYGTISSLYNQKGH